MRTFLAVLAVLVAAPLSGAPMFRNPLPMRLPAGAAEVLPGDFNGDGHIDVLAHAPSPAKYAVFLANGTGPFAPAAVTDVSIEPYAVAVGDLNGDGRSDVVAVDPDGTHLPALANADGSLTFGTTHTTASGVAGIAIGDFNGDQHADVATSSDATLTVSFGNGAGQFSGSATSAFDSSVGVPVPGDLNGDGKLDLIAGHYVFLNAGNGTFTRTGYVAGGQHVVGDFDVDGKLDVATILPFEHQVEVRLGNGDGTLGEAAHYASGYQPDSVSATDVDADGHVDLVISASWCNGISVLRGKADGTFHRMELLFAGVVRSVVAADFDRDQKIDVAGIESTDAATALAFVRGNGDGTFGVYRGFHTTRPVPQESSQTLGMREGVVADMNGDGKADVVAMQVNPQHPNNGRVVVLLNDGTGGLAEPLTTETTASGFPAAPWFAAGDVDSDGKQDVVVLPQQGAPFTLRGLGNGQFGTPVPFSAALRGKPVLGHFNADSSLDLFVPVGFTSAVYPGNGDGTFGAGIGGSEAYTPVTGDLNGDGRLDFVSSGSGSGVFAAINDGTGHFTRSNVTTEEVRPAALADFNGDAKLDLLLTAYTGTQMRFGNGDGTFAVPVRFTIDPVPNDPAPGPVTTADFDGDGKLDVAFATSVYLSNGDGTFRSRSRYRAHVDSTAVADMDGNGTPDLVGVNGQGDDVAILTTRTTADPTRTSTLTLTDDRGGAAQYAQAVTFTATVQGDGAVALTGVVRFTIDGADVALIAVNADGIATYTRAFHVGAHEITATYTGDEHYVTSADTASLAVTRAATELLIYGLPNPAPSRQRVTIVVSRFAPFANELPGPTGAITLRDGDTPLGVEVVNGAARISTLTVGTHQISADYPGDDNYLPSTASYTQEITRPVPQLWLQLPPAPVIAGQSVTIRAYFSSNTIPVPTGTITFYDHDAVIGSAPVVDGEATIQTTFAWGQRVLDADYAGDATWAPSSAVGNWPLTVFLGNWGTVPVIEAQGTNSSLYLRWSQIAGATSYKVWRKTTVSAPWELEATFDTHTSGASRSIPAGTSRLYAVTAIDANGNVSPMSAPDLATGFSFTDPLLTPGATPVRALHTTQLRSAVDAVRTFAGLPPFAYTYTAVAGAPVRALDLTQLRTALSQALGAIGMPAMPFTDAVPSIIRAAHVLELRSAVN